jgi:tRNA pseudouridine13 synthase
MYVHAYQSYVWNVVASARMSLSSTQALEGDLVLVKSASAPSAEKELNDPDEGGEFSLDETQESLATIKTLTADDIASGDYTIHDIVLPTPGFEVTYPPRDDLRRAYVETMSRDGLDPLDMRRVVREVSLVGHYRRIVHRPDDVQWDVLRYNGRETLLDTDETPTEGEFMALRVQLSLGTSQYATMALREICKRDSVQIQYWGKERDDAERTKREIETGTK